MLRRCKSIFTWVPLKYMCCKLVFSQLRYSKFKSLNTSQLFDLNEEKEIEKQFIQIIPLIDWIIWRIRKNSKKKVLMPRLLLIIHWINSHGSILNTPFMLWIGSHQTTCGAINTQNWINKVNLRRAQHWNNFGKMITAFECWLFASKSVRHGRLFCSKKSKICSTNKAPKFFDDFQFSSWIFNNSFSSSSPSSFLSPFRESLIWIIEKFMKNEKEFEKGMNVASIISKQY